MYSGIHLSPKYLLSQEHSTSVRLRGEEKPSAREKMGWVRSPSVRCHLVGMEAWYGLCALLGPASKPPLFLPVLSIKTLTTFFFKLEEVPQKKIIPLWRWYEIQIWLSLKLSWDRVKFPLTKLSTVALGHCESPQSVWSRGTKLPHDHTSWTLASTDLSRCDHE